ncbi:MAG TPA: hypothetical protein VKY26_03190, partial [Actinomycetota bacterium]|nr:hypothetical protein [Actinomycetota bacterium]
MERTGPPRWRGRTGGRSDRSDRRARRALIGLELFTGLAAVTGGVLLMVKPDGSLLQARTSALAGSPFHDWLLPGLLLALLVGVGFTVTALWELRG